MQIGKIEFLMFSSCSAPDAEEKAIMRRLFAYGVQPTGKKSIDKETLHNIELREAQLRDTITSKFLTVTKSEQEKIQSKKKEKRIECNPEAYPNSQKGAKLLGEQIFQAIKMKKDLEEKFKEKKLKEKKHSDKI